MLFDTGEEGIGKIYLSDVAEVSKVDNSEDTHAKVNGNDAVMLTFQKQSISPQLRLPTAFERRARNYP